MEDARLIALTALKPLQGRGEVPMLEKTETNAERFGRPRGVAAFTPPPAGRGAASPRRRRRAVSALGGRAVALHHPARTCAPSHDLPSAVRRYVVSDDVICRCSRRSQTSRISLRRSTIVSTRASCAQWRQSTTRYS